jgi:23S rRNA maturation mini-RNase III
MSEDCCMIQNRCLQLLYVTLNVVHNRVCEYVKNAAQHIFYKKIMRDLKRGKRSPNMWATLVIKKSNSHPPEYNSRTALLL